jgi:DNA-binding NtrC family response regulator
LNEFEIQLPLLKDRNDDIPMLAKAFVKDSNADLNKSIKGISIEAMKILLNYEWLGNVRELKHVIKRAVLLEESDEISPDVLSIKNEVNEKSNDYLNFDSNASFESIIDNVERDLIIRAIEQSDGNKSRAAEKLNINRKTLYRKIKYLNIPLS